MFITVADEDQISCPTMVKYLGPPASPVTSFVRDSPAFPSHTHTTVTKHTHGASTGGGGGGGGSYFDDAEYKEDDHGAEIDFPIVLTELLYPDSACHWSTTALAQPDGGAHVTWQNTPRPHPRQRREPGRNFCRQPRGPYLRVGAL